MGHSKGSCKNKEQVPQEKEKMSYDVVNENSQKHPSKVNDVEPLEP